MATRADRALAHKLATLVQLAMFLYVMFRAGKEAYKIRLYAIKTFGRVIHEFDPWFNFRATKYLADNGWAKFFTWFDYESWYPLGRPVGTTIYPGMQIGSVAIWRTMGKLLSAKKAMSLNDVCVFVPAWFGVSATAFLGMFSKECTGSWAAGATSACIMAILPAHLMRSVGGGYDNESIAMTAMCMTFFCWVRSLRADPSVTDGRHTRDSVLWGVLTGLAYIYMVAAWGGYVFVVNMIGAHACALFFVGRFSSKLHRAYSLFYVVGTLGAMRVPVVGWSPLKSTEQICPLLVFVAFQILEYCEVRRRRHGLSFAKLTLLRIKATLPVLLLAVAAGAYLQLTYNYFGPPSARVRGLFVKHTRTGNPLVDSVAEHQPANEQAYQQYLHNVYDIAPYGLLLSALSQLRNWQDGGSFLILYTLIAYYFSNRMARLVILLGPVASALGGVVLGFCADQLLLNATGRLLASAVLPAETDDDDDRADGADADKADADQKDAKAKAKASKPKRAAAAEKDDPLGALASSAKGLARAGLRVYHMRLSCLLRLALGFYLYNLGKPRAAAFYKYSHELSEQLSQPSIMFKAKLNNGKEIMLDDYREAYWWLRDHTAKDARVMAWWDYGYQIAGIANRTTIADGNTWNHEHIATLGRILSAPEEKAHRVARHLADYVLAWSGGGGDDLAKSPHMARIGNSVYHDICPGDPTCSQFGFYQGGQPTPMMEKSLLYKMVQMGQQGPDGRVISLDPAKFTHAFTSKYGKVRIFKIRNVSKKSKDWVADPANRICDAPGSWYCTGQYPPALHSLIAKRKPFAQLEDFNKKGDAASKKYVDDYHKRMEQGSGRRREADDGGYDEYGGDGGGGGGGMGELGLTPVGCYGSEGALGADKVYTGGDSGASLGKAMQWAAMKGKRYVALARSGVDGHVFAFDTAPKGKKFTDEGCEVPCADVEEFNCGCADAACGDSRAGAGEDNVRRWVVYEVPAEAMQAAEARQGSRKPKGKKKRKPKAEL